MNLTIDRDALSYLVRATAPAVATRTTIPALRCLKLTADEESLSLAATDGTLHITATCGQGVADVKRAGACLIPAATLSDAVKLAGSGPVSIAVGKVIELKTKGASYRVPTEDTDKFPDRSEPDYTTPLKLPAGTLTQLLRRVAFICTSKQKESDAFATTGVYLEASGSELSAVATDTFRMALATATLDSPASFKALIPDQTVSTILSAFADASDVVRVQVWNTQARFSTDRVQIHTPLLAGKVAPWRAIQTKMAVTSGSHLTDDPGALLAAFRRAAITRDDAASAVTVKATGAALVLSMSGTAGEGEVEHECPAHTGSPEAITTRLYPDHLCQWLQMAAGESLKEVKLSLKDDKTAAWLSAGDDWRYMTMPTVQRK